MISTCIATPAGAAVPDPATVYVQLGGRQPPWAGQGGSCGGALQVLVGDPKQLQASSELHNTHVPRSSGGLREFMQHHSRSTMERLSRTPRSAFGAGGANVSALTTQYRMHADVCHVVSEHFYRCGGLGVYVHNSCLLVACAEATTGTCLTASSWQ